MKKIKNTVLAAACCTGLMVLGCVGLAQAQDPADVTEATEASRQEEVGPGVKTEQAVPAETVKQREVGPGVKPEQDLEAVLNQIRIWGPVLGVEEDMIRIDNQSGVSFAGEIVLNISDEFSRVLDGENGYPVDLGSIKEGDFIYAYIGPAMTMSLPPMTTAEMVICQIPQDGKAPDYIEVKSMEQQADGSWRLETQDQVSYTVPADCQILPYLTRNIVTLADVQESSTCLVWSDEAGSVQKIVLFPSDEA